MNKLLKVGWRGCVLSEPQERVVWLLVPPSLQLSGTRQEGPSEMLLCPRGLPVMLHCLKWVQTNQSGTLDWQPVYSSSMIILTVFSVQQHKSVCFLLHTCCMAPSFQRMCFMVQVNEELSFKQRRRFYVCL